MQIQNNTVAIITHDGQEALNLRLKQLFQQEIDDSVIIPKLAALHKAPLFLSISLSMLVKLLLVETRYFTKCVW